MNHGPNVSWALIAGAAALSISLVTAFTSSDTGARNVTASVVNDNVAYLAIERNGNSAFKGFVTATTTAKLTVTFNSGNADAPGSGINEESGYEFDSIINITNKGTSTRNVDITIAGTDSALCLVQLTTTEDQSAASYSDNPTAVSVAKNAKAYLGLKVSGTGKTSGQSVACTIAVTAA